MDIRYTGVRNYERVQSISNDSQVRGTVMTLRRNHHLVYPPSQTHVNQLTLVQVRDQFNNLPFLGDLSVDQRREWLLTNASTHHDLYMSAIPDLYVKFDTIGFFKTKGKKNDPFLTDEVMNHLLQHNPDDSEGFWSMKYVFGLFPMKAGSRGKTLVFRPSVWTLCDYHTAIISGSGSTRYQWKLWYV